MTYNKTSRIALIGKSMSYRKSILIVALSAWASSFNGIQVSRGELVGFWNFDGNVQDLSGFGNNGQLVDAQYSSNIPTLVGVGQSLDFSDDAHHVLIEANESLDSPTFTLAMYVYDRGQVGALERLTSREGDTFETAINVHPPFDGMGQYAFYSPSAGWQWSETIASLNEWQHVAYVATEDETLLVYVDGELAWESTPWNANPSGFMHIGNRWNDAEGFDGLIDNVGLWNEALGEELIREIAATGCVICDGLQGDVNDDGSVDIDDLNIIAARFGQSPATRTEGDLNFNKEVELLDFRIWKDNQGAVADPPTLASQPAVPEPSGLELAAIAAVATAGCGGWVKRRLFAFTWSGNHDGQVSVTCRCPETEPLKTHGMNA